MDDMNVKIDRLYPNRVIKNTEDSKTIKQMNRAKGKKGISFYCSKRHEFVFIENTRI